MDYRTRLAIVRTRIAPYARRARARLEAVTLRELAIAIAAVILLDITLFASCGLRGCPAPEALRAYQPDGASVLLDRRGREFADLAPHQRESVALDALPDHVTDAFVAVEDRRFFEHNGVDWRRVMGAAASNIFSKGGRQGSSTITMQLSRNIFSEQLRAGDISLRRKLFEARVATSIEKKFSKNEILELYLNHIYFGGGAYGIQAAARHYFDKPASRLELHETALLAAMPKAPTHYDPRERAAAARDRRNLVLRLMADQDRISPAAAERAQERGLAVSGNPPAQPGRAGRGGYFAQMVRRELEREIGEEIYRKRLRVFTTLDINAQRAAEDELNEGLRHMDSATDQVQGAVVIMETLTGDVLALVGGRDFRKSQFNRALLAKRQAGSAFKPFIYAAAIDEGYPPSQPILDTPYSLTSQGVKWEPRNFDNRFAGKVTMREALVQSRNIPSVRLAAAVGHGPIESMAEASGIRAEIERTPMVALGIVEVTPLELVFAYSTFAGMGTRAKQRLIHRVEDEKGKVIYETELDRKETIAPGVAFVLTDMLADAVDFGTGSKVREAGFRGPAAGKTGTTNEAADNWFVGYTPDITAGVWVGYDEQRALTNGASGGAVAAPIWGAMMRRVYQERTLPQSWLIAGDIKARLVDPESGRILEEGCRPRRGQPRQEVFLEDEEPETVCPEGEPRLNWLQRMLAALSSPFRNESSAREPRLGGAAEDPDLGAVRLTRRGREEPGNARSRNEDDDRKGRKKRGKGKKSGKDSDADSDGGS